VITGAGRGIGEAIAAAFSREGASLALVARTKAQLDEVRSCREDWGLA
jgi:short-subunit dehydrogenase